MAQPVRHRTLFFATPVPRFRRPEQKRVACFMNLKSNSCLTWLNRNRDAFCTTLGKMGILANEHSFSDWINNRSLKFYPQNGHWLDMLNSEADRYCLNLLDSFGKEKHVGMQRRFDSATTWKLQRVTTTWCSHKFIVDMSMSDFGKWLPGRLGWHNERHQSQNAWEAGDRLMNATSCDFTFRWFQIPNEHNTFDQLK